MTLRPARRAFGVAAAALLTAAVVLALPAPAGAHPLGNFTVNTYSGVSVEPERVAVDFVVDMAEIPTFQIRREIDADGDGPISEAEGARWAAGACAGAAERITVAVDGRRAPLSATSSGVLFPPGTAGLDTLRLECGLTAATGRLPRASRLTFRNDAYTDRVGWREVTAVGDGARLESSDVPAVGISARLSRYPDDLLQSPPDQRQATLDVEVDIGATPRSSADAGSGPEGDDRPLPALPRGVDGAARSFMDLVARQELTVGFGALAIGVAVLLGGIHALAPGHGKTVMAAYLVGQRGSLRQGGIIALTVTATHTAGVLILGLVLSASTTLAPESVYPWLELASGVLLAAVGAGLLRRARSARRTHRDDHPHTHPHPHSPPHPHPHLHPHPHPPVDRPAQEVALSSEGQGAAVATLAPPTLASAGAQAAADRPEAVDPLPSQTPLARRTLVAMGVAGGLVPSPSALVVLLGAIALGRAWFGVALVIAYGLGMACALTAAGLLLVRARRLLDRRSTNGRRAPSLARLARGLPTLTATIIVVVGLALAVRAVSQL